MRTILKPLVIGLLALGVGSSSLAAALCVDATNAHCFSTIQAAVDTAQPGTVINIALGNYPQTISVPLGKDGLTPRGARPAAPANSSSNSACVARVACATIDALGNNNANIAALEIRSANVTVENLCVINGSGDGIHFGCDDGSGGCSVAGNNAPGAILRNVVVNGVGDDCIDVEDENGTLTDFSALNCGDKCVSWNGANAVIDRGVVRGCTDHGINLNVSDNARVSNVAISNTSNTNSDCIRARGNDIDLTDNTLRSCRRDGIHRENGTGGLIKNNTVIGTVDDGLQIDSDGVTVEGNTIVAAQDIGVSVFANTVTLRNNRVRSSDNDGINFTGDDGVLDGNRIDSSADFGILVDGDRVQVTGNTVGHSANDGIEVLTAADNVISGNTVEAAGFQGIDVIGDRMTVVRNTVGMSDSKGIEVDCLICTGVRIADNTVTGTLRGDAECFDIDSHSSAGVVFENNVARYCGEDGVQLLGTQIVARGNTVTDSGSLRVHPGFNVSGTGHLVEGNLSDFNRNDGFNVDGAGIVFRANSADCNAASGFGVDAAPPALALVYDGNRSFSNNLAGLEVRTGTTATVTNNTTAGNSIGFCNAGGTATVVGNNFMDGSSNSCPAQ